MLSKRDFLLTSAGAIAASGLPKYGKEVMAQSVSDFSAVRDLIAAQMDKKVFQVRSGCSRKAISFLSMWQARPQWVG
jgi:hypothetical protein